MVALGLCNSLPWATSLACFWWMVKAVLFRQTFHDDLFLPAPAYLLLCGGCCYFILFKFNGFYLVFWFVFCLPVFCLEGLGAEQLKINVYIQITRELEGTSLAKNHRTGRSDLCSVHDLQYRIHLQQLGLDDHALSKGEATFSCGNLFHRQAALTMKTFLLM